jgi:hypothetical protein
VVSGSEADDPVHPPDWLLEAVRIARREYRDSWEIAAAMEAAQREPGPMTDLKTLNDYLRARAKVRRRVEESLTRLTDLNSLASILERQQDAMWMAQLQTPRVPQAAELQKAEASLLARLPKTEEDVQQVAQAVAEIQADPKKRSMVDHLTGGLKRSHVAGLTPFALLVLLAWLLIRVAGLPLSAHESPAQEAVTSNDLTVIAILIAAYAVIKSRD